MFRLHLAEVTRRIEHLEDATIVSLLYYHGLDGMVLLGELYYRLVEV